MVSTFTPNINLEQPARGDDVGIWDTPVNSNSALTDLVVGGLATVALNNSPVVLSAAQFQANNITFNSTLTSNVTVTFPTSFKKPYTVGNFCTGSSAFTITLQTTAASAGAQVACCPPGEYVSVFNDGAGIRFFNMGRIGSYMDYAGSSLPSWISGCTIPPYLNCDGSAISSASYPVLFSMLGGTLPDARGRSRAALNQGTGRMTSASGGLDGNTLLAGGGSDSKTLVTANLPPYTPAGSIVANSVDNVMHNGGPVISIQGAGGGSVLGFGLNNTPTYGPLNVPSAFTGSAQGGTSSAVSVMQPTLVGGLTLIRAG
ncbi:hypothetical protein [Bradyrhizobium genosp. A]|uniref:hypothetical protein n=1 Tax=Bradyrhizobium genosp. A TaxID=83626 RepID=UPI003CFA3FA0